MLRNVRHFRQPTKKTAIRTAVVCAGSSICGLCYYQYWSWNRKSSDETPVIFHKKYTGEPVYKDNQEVENNIPFEKPPDEVSEDTGQASDPVKSESEILYEQILNNAKKIISKIYDIQQIRIKLLETTDAPAMAKYNFLLLNAIDDYKIAIAQFKPLTPFFK